MCAMRRRLLVCCALLLTMGACSSNEPRTAPPPESSPPESSDSAPEAPDTIHVTGALALGGGAVIHDLPEEGQCTAHSEYTDIKPGEQVLIHNAAGDVVAATELGDGSRFQDSEDCVWAFDVDVPAGGGFYSASVLEWESDVIAEADLATTIVAILPAG